MCLTRGSPEVLHLLVLALDRLPLFLGSRFAGLPLRPGLAIGAVSVTRGAGRLIGARPRALEDFGQLSLRRVDGALVLALEGLADRLDPGADLRLLLIRQLVVEVLEQPLALVDEGVGLIPRLGRGAA